MGLSKGADGSKGTGGSRDTGFKQVRCLGGHGWEQGHE